MELVLPALEPATLNPPLNVTLVTDDQGLEKLAEFVGREHEFCLDIETNVVPWFYPRKIRTVQIGNKNEQFVVDLLALVGNDSDCLQQWQGDYGAKIPEISRLQILKDILFACAGNTHLKVGHSLRFEYETLKWCLGVRIWHLYDTKEADKVIHAGVLHLKSSDLLSMEGAAERWLKVRIDKSQQKSFDLCTPLTEEQVQYAALDVRIPMAIRQAQAPSIEKGGLKWAVQIENDALPAFGDLHLNGIYLNANKWNALLEGVIVKHAANIAELDKHFLPIVGSKNRKPHDLTILESTWRDCKDTVARAAARVAFQDAKREVKKFEKQFPTFDGEAAINYGSTDQLLAALRKMGYGPKKLPDTNDRSLDKLSGNEVIDALREYRETQKVITSYGGEFLKTHIHQETGRVHSNIDQNGADTGRTTSNKPNIQNINKGKDWRSCFEAQNGFVIITMDYNGCELRILAELSGEPVWLEAFRNGWDVHSVGAEIIFGQVWKDAAIEGCKYYSDHAKCKCPKHVDLRDRIKAINFGIAYGMEAKKLAETIHCSVEDAQALLDLYRSTFKRVTAYLKISGQNAVGTLQSRTMSGRRRFYRKPNWDKAKEIATDRMKKWNRTPDQMETKHVNSALSGMYGSIEREGKNTPIQGTNADMIKLAMGCGFDESGKPFAWHLIEPVYGAKLVNEVHDELVTEAKKENAEECSAAIADCMSRAGAAFVKSIPMTTEAHIAGCWQK